MAPDNEAPNPDAKDPKILGSLALGNRYIAAWGEISARIQARDRIILTFVTVAFTIFGFGLVNPKSASIAVIVPYLAIIVTELVVTHTYMIGLISMHLGDITRASSEGVQELGLAHWSKVCTRHPPAKSTDAPSTCVSN